MGVPEPTHCQTLYSMQLCIRMTCGRTVLMECDASDTVGQLEDAVTAAEGITGHSLKSNGRHLGVTSATLRECALETGCMLHVMLPLKGGGNGLRACQRTRAANTSLMLRRTDSTMISSDCSGNVVLVAAPRIAHKRQLSFSRNQVVWSRSNASQIQNKKCKIFQH